MLGRIHHRAHTEHGVGAEFSSAPGVFLCVLCAFCGGTLLPASPAFAGPYAPAANRTGTTALAADDPRFVAWATGWRDYQVGAGVETDGEYEWMDPAQALGPADCDPYEPYAVTVLGDHGRITLTFDRPIGNGPGDDFAVFENAATHYFLELAYVEVSADGVSFRRFPNDSISDPTAGYGAVDPTNIDGLAGKYLAGYGTPFDLSAVGLNQAVAVRLIDIVGDPLPGHTDFDTSGDPIYDPYPTWGTAGFDLDAVGVLHELIPGDTNFDRLVDDLDLAALQTSLHSGRGADWARGDFDGDGRATLLDLVILARNYGTDYRTGSAGPATAAVPEPAGLSVLALVAPVLLRPRERRR